MGRPLLNDWQLTEHFIKICPGYIKTAWIEFENQPGTNKTNRLTMTYNQFQEDMRSVWTAADNKRRMLIKYHPTSALQQTAPTAPTHRKPETNRPAAPPNPQPPIAQPPDPTAELKDIQLICKGCQVEFTFTSGQQEYHALKGYDNTPVWCRTCRPRTQEMKQAHLKTLQCFNFNKGICERGDQCSFRHGEVKTVSNIAVAKNLEIEEPGYYDGLSDEDFDDFELETVEDAEEYNRSVKSVFNTADSTKTPEPRLATVNWDLDELDY